MTTIVIELRTTLALALEEDERNKGKHSTVCFCVTTSMLKWRNMT